MPTSDNVNDELSEAVTFVKKFSLWLQCYISSETLLLKENQRKTKQIGRKRPNENDVKKVGRQDLFLCKIL